MNSHVPNHSHQLPRTVAIESNQRARVSSGFFVGLFTGFVCSTIVFVAIFLAVISTSVLSRAFGDETIAAQNDLRPIGEMRRDVEAFLKNSKSKDDLDVQVGGIIDLCYIHQEIVSDPRFATNRQLKSIRAVAAARLKTYRKTIEVEKLRHQRKLKKQQAETNKQLLAGKSVAVGNASGGSEIENEQVAKTGQLPRPTSSRSSYQNEASNDADMNDSMYGTANSLARLTGGPSQMFGYLSGNFAPPWDHGEELVNLIENTINPDFWQSNGGGGIIQYYRPSRIIVVGATSKVQDDLTNMLRNLRRLSR